MTWLTVAPLEVDEREWFVSTTHTATRRGRFSMALTMFAVVAVAPTMADLRAD